MSGFGQVRRCNAWPFRTRRVDSPQRQRYNQRALRALSKAWVSLLGSWLLTSCGPPSIGTWQSHPPAPPAPADLQIQGCTEHANCALHFTSFANKRWSFDPSTPEARCSVWLRQDGSWVDHPPAEGLLELWFGSQNPQCQGLRPRSTTPRWLILPQPVESAQSGGMGTRRPRYTFSRQQKMVRRALIEGLVDGVVSLGHGETELLLDLELATIRSARQWLDRSVFSLIFGKNPALGDAPWSFAARSHRPTLWTKKKNLRIEIRGLSKRKQKITMQLLNTQKRILIELPRLAPKHTPLRGRAHVEPCLDCAARRRGPQAPAR